MTTVMTCVLSLRGGDDEGAAAVLLRDPLVVDRVLERLPVLNPPVPIQSDNANKQGSEPTFNQQQKKLSNV